MPNELRPKYYYFNGYSAAKNFADIKNSKSRVNLWLVAAHTNDYGYTVYNIRKIKTQNTNNNINPALYESYEPLDGSETEINLDDFTMRLNCNT